MGAHAGRPKHPSQRARNNISSTRAILPAAPDRKLPTPRLPSDIDWNPLVVKWWKDMWAAPMSGEYHASDLHQLFLLAMLYNDFYAEEPGTNARTRLSAEIRQHRMAFGLTPLDRRRLEWTIEQVDEAQDKGRRRRATAPVAPMPSVADDPRQALRAI
jgi:hypothetical protein